MKYNCDIQSVLETEKKFSKFYELMKSACLLKSLNVNRFNKYGVTLIVPTDSVIKSYIEKFNKNRENAIEVQKELKKYIIANAYLSADDFDINKDIVVTILKDKVSVDVKGENVVLGGATIQLEKDIEFMADSKYAIWKISKGDITVGEKSSLKRKEEVKVGSMELSEIRRVREDLCKQLMKQTDEEVVQFNKLMCSHLALAGYRDVLESFLYIDTKYPKIHVMCMLLIGDGCTLGRKVIEFFDKYLLAEGDMKLSVDPKSLKYELKQVPTETNLPDTMLLCSNLEELRMDYIQSDVTPDNFLQKLKELSNQFLSVERYTPLLDEWLKTEYKGFPMFLLLCRVFYFAGIIKHGKTFDGRSIAMADLLKHLDEILCNKDGVALLFLGLACDYKTGGYMIADEADIIGAHEMVNSTAFGFVDGACECNKGLGFNVVGYGSHLDGEEGIIEF